MYKLIAACVAFLYKLTDLLPKQRKITFFSRQSRHGSLDFRMLSEAVQDRLPEVEVRICATDPENVDKKAFVLSMPRMIYHAATSRVCVLEGYIPAVSIPRLDDQTRVIQLWHALGAIKKFGYQSIGTSAGRSLEESEALRMHKNYDWVVAAGPGAVQSYGEAFGYDESVVKPLGMPRMDYLFSDNESRIQRSRSLCERFPFLRVGGDTRVLYVPTLRKGEGADGWLTREVANLAKAFAPYGCTLIVAGHPLDKGCDSALEDAYPHVHVVRGVASIDLLGSADCVITDYSAIAFEAGLIGKPVWFYVPDIDDYRISPGLNIDPLAEFPDGAFADACDLARTIADGRDPACFRRFVCRYFKDIGAGCTERLAAFVEECYFSTLGDEKGE